MGGEIGLFENLGLAAVMAFVCLAIHFAGIAVLVRALRVWRIRFGTHQTIWRQAAIMAVSVFGLLAMHTIEIWAYALVYMGLGEFQSVDNAVYFSLTTYAATGYGDIVLDQTWRLFGATESMIGLLMLGWSIAFMVTTVNRLCLFAEDHHEPKP